MNPFELLAQSNHWHGIWPEISLGLGAVALLLVAMFTSSSRLGAVLFFSTFAIQALVLVLLVSGFLPRAYGYNFGGLLMHTDLGQLMRIFFLSAGLLLTYMGQLYFRQRVHMPQAEFFATLLITTAALMLFVESTHFVLFFITLETFTVGLFVLISYARENPFSLEAGLKFLIMAALSSSIMLFGIVLLYGTAGLPGLENSTVAGLQFENLAAFIAANSDHIWVRCGCVFVFVGLAFKMGLVPFQIWIPDVYQGAPVPVTAYLSVCSKAAGFIAFINLVRGPFATLDSFLTPLLCGIAAITILFGNLAALKQDNVKRLMGLSGIAHAGYLLIGVVAAFYVDWAVNAVVFYLYTYLLGSFVVFIVMGHMDRGIEDGELLEHYEGLSVRNPFAALSLLFGLGSLAGVPPFVGFIGKLFLFMAAFEAGLYGLLIVAIIGVVLSFYYYFGWIREAYFSFWGASSEANLPKKPLESSTFALHLQDRLLLGLLMFMVLACGVYQAFLSHWVF